MGRSRGGVSAPNFFWGGVSAPNLGGCLKFSGGGLKFFFPFFFNFFSPKKSFWDAHPPPPETVNAWPVRILLECILVGYFVWKKL